MVLEGNDHVTRSASLAGLVTHPSELSGDMSARLLRERPVIGRNVVLAGVHGNQRKTGARVGNVAEAAVRGAVGIVDDRVRVAALCPEGLVGQRVGALCVCGNTGREVLAVVVVEVVVAVDHVEARIHAGGRELLLATANFLSRLSWQAYSPSLVRSPGTKTMSGLAATMSASALSTMSSLSRNILRSEFSAVV